MDSTSRISNAGSLPRDVSDAVPVGVIGRGAVGIVEKIQLADGRVFALKRLSGDWNDSSAAARFRREARIVADLDHPHIVRSAGGIDERGAWIVMDYVAGPTLHDLLYSGPVSTANALAVMEGVCSAASYAHTHGIVHRDIAPGNVLISPRGAAVLTDFGVATMVGSDRNVSLLTFRTSPGALIGTPSYMSPEAAAGSSDVTQLWDVYSLGVLAYRLLVGRLPFDNETSLLAILDAQINRAVPDPSTFGVDLPGGVTAAVLHALQKAPEDRTASSETLWNELAGAAEERWPRWRERVMLSSDAQAVQRAQRPNDPIAEARPTSQRTDVGALVDLGGEPGRPPAPIAVTVVEPTVFTPKAPRRKLRVLGGVGAGVAVAVATIAASGGFSAHGPATLAVEHVRVSVSASARRATCSASKMAVGRITTNGESGELTVTWTVGGAPAAPRRVPVLGSQHLVTVSRIIDGQDGQRISLRASASTSAQSAAVIATSPRCP